MPQVKVELPGDVVNYLQALDYELGGLQVLHTHALGAGLSEDKTQELREQFQKKYAAFQLAKLEVAEEYRQVINGEPWWVDYVEGVLYVGEKQ